MGALAVGRYGRGSDADDIGCSKGLESTLIVSGGGNMESRAWCMEGGRGQGGRDAGGPREEATGAAYTPPVRYSSFWGFVISFLGT